MMINHKGVAALDGHPKQQRETEPSSKEADSEVIILPKSVTKQLANKSKLIVEHLVSKSDLPTKAELLQQALVVLDREQVLLLLKVINEQEKESTTF